MRKTLLCLVLLLFVSSSCTIGRVYKGTPVKASFLNSVQKGKTQKGEILSMFGAPTRILNQTNGDIFIYEYFRENSSQLQLSEPVFSRTTFFTYNKSDTKVDSLVFLFNREGVVESFGYSNETSQLRTL